MSARLKELLAALTNLSIFQSEFRQFLTTDNAANSNNANSAFSFMSIGNDQGFNWVI